MREKGKEGRNDRQEVKRGRKRMKASYRKEGKKGGRKRRGKRERVYRKDGRKDTQRIGNFTDVSFISEGRVSQGGRKKFP